LDEAVCRLEPIPQPTALQRQSGGGRETARLSCEDEAPTGSQHKKNRNFRIVDLNLAAGAADASRAMLRTLCLNVAHPIAVLAHAHFLSTAKPTAYR
jgi:hypothetical protein